MAWFLNESWYHKLMKEQKIKVLVGGLIKKDDKYLMLKRHQNDEVYPGKWEFPSGGIDFGEEVEDALIREVREEAGLDISNIKRRIIGVTKYIIEKEDFVRDSFQINYLIEPTKIEDIKLSDEHEEFDWVEAGDKRIDDYLIQIVNQAKNN